MPKRLPGTARPIDPIKPPCHLIEIDLLLLTAAAQNAFQVDLIAAVVGQFPRPANRELGELAQRAVGRDRELVESPFSLAAGLHQARILQ